MTSSIIRLTLVGYLLSASTISQTFIQPNSHTIPINALKYEFNRFINDRNNLSSFSNKKESSFKLSINSYLAFNSGHPNIDNHSEFYLSGASSKILSARFEYINPWLFIEVEPYNLFQKQNGKTELAGIDLNRRGETLSLEDFATLSNHIHMCDDGI